MKMRSIASILSTAALLVTVACSDTVAAPDQIQTTPRVSAFVGALEQQGAKVIPMERLSPQAYCLSVGARRLEVNRENVYAFEYESTDAASRDAAAISPDASSISAAGTACRPAWTGPPRFYQQDRLLVLYVGTNQGLIGVLDRENFR